METRSHLGAACHGPSTSRTVVARHSYRLVGGAIKHLMACSSFILFFLHGDKQERRQAMPRAGVDSDCEVHHGASDTYSTSSGAAAYGRRSMPLLRSASRSSACTAAHERDTPVHAVSCCQRTPNQCLTWLQCHASTRTSNQKCVECGASCACRVQSLQICHVTTSNIVCHTHTLLAPHPLPPACPLPSGLLTRRLSKS